MCLQQNYQGRVNSIDFHRSEDLLVTAGEDDAIRLYNTQTGMEIKHLFSKKHGVCNLCYTHAPQAVVHASNKVCSGRPCNQLCLYALCNASLLGAGVPEPASKSVMLATNDGHSWTCS